MGKGLRLTGSKGFDSPNVLKVGGLRGLLAVDTAPISFLIVES